MNHWHLKGPNITKPERNGSFLNLGTADDKVSSARGLVTLGSIMEILLELQTFQMLYCSFDVDLKLHEQIKVLFYFHSQDKSVVF